MKNDWVRWTHTFLTRSDGIRPRGRAFHLSKVKGGDEVVGMNFIHVVILAVLSLLLGLAVWAEVLRQTGLTVF